MSENTYFVQANGSLTKRTTAYMGVQKKKYSDKETSRHKPGRPGPVYPFKKKRSRVFTFNPAADDRQREEPLHAHLILSQYSQAAVENTPYADMQKLLAAVSKEKVNWIQVAGLRTQDVKTAADYFGFTQLTVEDILSVGQRAKMDEIPGGLFCLLPFIDYNEETDEIELHQVNLILEEHTVLSLSSSEKDFFAKVRSNLQMETSRLRHRNADFLFYYLLDAVVDNYFNVIESLGTYIEDIEEQIIRNPNSATLLKLNNLRQKTGALRRAIMPVKDLVAGILKAEESLIDSKTGEYIEDVHDHIIQANEITDSYRDLIMNLQSLYINQVSLKMNEIMKVLALVTALFAPLTLIAGIYGMNFDNMPELHVRSGYFITLGVMALIFILMLYIFKRRKWF